MGEKKAIVAGHICIDIIPVFSGKEEKEIEDLFRPGQLVAMDPAKISVGGAVSNTGVGMKLLGADVELMGMTGKDAFGQIVREVLEKYDAWGESMISRDKYADKIHGIITCYDRMIIQGYIPNWSHEIGRAHV